MKTIEGRRQCGTQKEVVTKLLGCVEHSTLTRRIIAGNYNKWIFFLQEFDLDFASMKSKK
jgi:hypothetical protein